MANLARAYASHRPPLRSYFRLGNLMRLGAFWVVLAAVARFLVG